MLKISPQETDLIRQQIERLLRDNPELEDDDRLRADMIEGSTDAVEALRRLEQFRREVEANSKALAELIKQYTSRRARMEMQIDSVREVMLAIMQAGRLKSQVLPEATISVRLSPPSLYITDDKALPKEYMIHPDPYPDKRALAAALNSGKSIPGCNLSNQQPHISIRTA